MVQVVAPLGDHHTTGPHHMVVVDPRDLTASLREAPRVDLHLMEDTRTEEVLHPTGPWVATAAPQGVAPPVDLGPHHLAPLSLAHLVQCLRV
jgi:hypothetical protein